MFRSPQPASPLHLHPAHLRYTVSSLSPFDSPRKTRYYRLRSSRLLFPTLLPSPPQAPCQGCCPIRLLLQLPFRRLHFLPTISSRSAPSLLILGSYLFLDPRPACLPPTSLVPPPASLSTSFQAPGYSYRSTFLIAEGGEDVLSGAEAARHSHSRLACHWHQPSLRL
jgi:hypothetical protein